MRSLRSSDLMALKNYVSCLFSNASMCLQNVNTTESLYKLGKHPNPDVISDAIVKLCDGRSGLLFFFVC